MDEIDGIIRELERLRERLRSEGERVNREIANYTDLTGAAISAMKVTPPISGLRTRAAPIDVVSAAHLPTPAF